MKTALVTIIILLFFTGASFSGQIHFIEAHPEYEVKDGSEFTINYPASIYIANKPEKELYKRVEILPKDGGFRELYTDYDNGVIVVVKDSGVIGSPDLHFAVVNMNTPETIKHLSIKGGSSSYFYRICELPGKGVYFVAKFSGKTVGINVETGEEEILSQDVFKYAKATGEVGGPGYDDYLIHYPVSDSKSLKIGVFSGEYFAQWELPEMLSFKENEVVAMLVNNNAMRAFPYGSGQTKGVDDYGYTPFYIFDKNKKEWHRKEIRGGANPGRGFGYWLTGYVADSSMGRKIPGASKVPEDWKGIDEETGESENRYAYQIYESEGIYTPGLLYLYNAETRKIHYIKTNDGDSEVLMVSGGTVYYRVFDEIYEAAIGEQFIEVGTLIAKDPKIVDIHWAFMGPDQVQAQ